MRSTQNGFSRRSAERIAREIELDIIQNQMVAGDWVGSESELMTRYGVSRGVIREAVTLVEHHMQAETRRGSGGGLVVVDPDVSVITEIASLYLARKHVSVVDLFETRFVLESKAIQEIIASADPEALATMQHEARRTMPPSHLLPEGAERFHLALAELSGNGVLQMLVPILSGLVKEVWSARHRKPDVARNRTVWDNLCTEHASIANAIVARDVDNALAALQEHMTTMRVSLSASERVIAPLLVSDEQRLA